VFASAVKKKNQRTKRPLAGYAVAHASVTRSTRLRETKRLKITMTAKNDMWPCVKCKKNLPADDALIISDFIYCTFCAIIEQGYYAKPEEHLPDEYYLWLEERDGND
jgi:hypothetical protein